MTFWGSIKDFFSLDPADNRPAQKAYDRHEQPAYVDPVSNVYINPETVRSETRYTGLSPISTPRSPEFDAVLKEAGWKDPVIPLEVIDPSPVHVRIKKRIKKALPIVKRKAHKK